MPALFQTSERCVKVARIQPRNSIQRSIAIRRQRWTKVEASCHQTRPNEDQRRWTNPANRFDALSTVSGVCPFGLSIDKHHHGALKLHGGPRGDKGFSTHERVVKTRRRCCVASGTRKIFPSWKTCKPRDDTSTDRFLSVRKADFYSR